MSAKGRLGVDIHIHGEYCAIELALVRRYSVDKVIECFQVKVSRLSKHVVAEHRIQMTRWKLESERGNSAAQSRGSCGLFIVTIIDKPYARTYVRTKDTGIIPTNQNQP